MSSTNPSNEEMTFELRLQQEAIIERSGPGAGAAFEAVYNWNPEPLDDDSDDEEEDWSRRGRRNARLAAPIDALEADTADSDPEPVSQSGVPSSFAELQSRLQAERAQGHVSEADRDIFEEYFGDRYRIPIPPTGHGWENTARIAAGERISNQIYGPSIDAVRNTTLEEPVFVSAGPPQGLCASRRALQRRRRAEAERARQERLFQESVFAYENERQIREEMGRPADQFEDALRLHRRSNDLEAMRKELNARAMVFKEKDPAGFEQWADHINLAHSCSTSKSRQHQILQWYTRGVPNRVLRQIRRVELYYTTEAQLKERLFLAQVRIGARRAPDPRYHAKDDDIWAGNIKRLFFGFDPEKTVNGFQDYVPKGEGAAMIKHLTVNFAARRIRVQHATKEHFCVLAAMMNMFANKALLVLSDAELVRGADPQLVERTRESLEDHLLNPLQYQPEEEASSLASDPHEADGGSDSGSDHSTVEEITNSIPNAARVLEAAEFILRDEIARNICAGIEQRLSEDEDQEDASGNIPPDSEDDDGDESMDESSD